MNDNQLSELNGLDALSNLELLSIENNQISALNLEKNQMLTSNMIYNFVTTFFSISVCSSDLIANNNSLSSLSSLPKKLKELWVRRSSFRYRNSEDINSYYYYFGHS